MVAAMVAQTAELKAATKADLRVEMRVARTVGYSADSTAGVKVEL